MEKRRDLDERDTQDSGQAKHPVVRDEGKKPIALNDVDTLADDELSSGNLPNPSPAKAKARKIDRARDTHITLHSAILIAVCSTEQWTEVKVSQTKHSRMHFFTYGCNAHLTCLPRLPNRARALHATHNSDLRPQ